MLDLRPVLYVIGLLVCLTGSTMLIPVIYDMVDQHKNWQPFLLGMSITLFSGGLMVLTCRPYRKKELSIRQIFVLTAFTWTFLPAFGALPFVLTGTSTLTDAMFEAMSGYTTTGSTILANIEGLSRSLQLWRGVMQWFGGIGIILITMAFLPAMKIGGMQFFKSEGFDTLGKVLPRAAGIAGSITLIYGFFTLACAVSYAAAGMSTFDALVHAMTTVSTGGMANYDASFAAFNPAAEYVACFFMFMASLPFVRYIQLIAGSAKPLYYDSQVRGFFYVCIFIITVLTFYQVSVHSIGLEQAFRKVMFNSLSIGTGTGYASEDFGTWGSFPVAILFIVGLIGGCTGSTCCSIKIFRYQIMIAAIKSNIRRIYSPHSIQITRYAGRAVSPEVISSVASFFFLFFTALVLITIGLSMFGLDLVTALSGAATSLANVGPGIGQIIGPATNFEALPDGATWLLTFAMLLGRLELVSILVFFNPLFWRY